MTGNIVLTYKLPAVIKALQKGWLASCQTSAVVNGLLTVLSIQLLEFITSRDFPDGTNPRAYTFLILLSYSSLVFNLSATFSSLVLTDRLGEIPIRASQQSDLPTEGSVDATSSYLLKRYGAGVTWNWGVLHWIFCLLAGTWCTIIQILVFVLLQESVSVTIAIACVIAFSSFPFILLLLSPITSRRRTSP